MENQHRKITGYRELTQEEIDLMNRIKQAGRELLALSGELTLKLQADLKKKAGDANRSRNKKSDEQAELERFQLAEPQKWNETGRASIQLGVMALVRAVAQPSDC